MPACVTCKLLFKLTVTLERPKVPLPSQTATDADPSTLVPWRHGVVRAVKVSAAEIGEEIESFVGEGFEILPPPIVEHRHIPVRSTTAERNDVG